MKLEEMQQYLVAIQNDSTETKILNAILSVYADLKELENKVDSIMTIISESAGENAEPVNNDIKEDNTEEVPITEIEE